MLNENVCISWGNAKMGLIPSVSLPVIKMCRNNAPCYKLCYAKRITRLRKTVNDSYERNLRILKSNPDRFWKEVDNALFATTVFRFFVSGDIPDKDFLKKMVTVVRKNKQCQTLVFTKRYEWVNEYLQNKHRLPKNLHIIFSAWKGLQMSNPFLLPECHIIYKDGSTTAHDGNTILCSGNCFGCFQQGVRCFNAKKGDQILIKQH